MDSRTGDLPVRQIQWPLLRVIASEAKQSMALQREKGWIASSRALLAMIWLASLELTADQFPSCVFELLYRVEAHIHFRQCEKE